MSTGFWPLWVAHWGFQSDRAETGGHAVAHLSETAILC